MTRLSLARDLAARAHAGQTYGSDPYTRHLAECVAVLEAAGITDEDVLAAAWLHDAVEDTPLTIEEVKAALGERVAALVDAVTDGPGKNRAERKEKPYRLIPRTPGAVLVKLADRIANVEAAPGHRPELLGMYRKEQEKFREKLYKPGEADELWARLDRALAE